MSAQPATETIDERCRDKWPAVLAEMIDVTVAEFRRGGMGDADAWKWAERAILGIAGYVGGRSIYLPRGDAVTEAIRDRQIWSEFNGHNTVELARKHELTERSIQRILDEQRGLHIARVQRSLF